MDKIKEIIYQICEIEIEDEDINLFSPKVGIKAIDMIYIVAEIEKYFNVNVFKKFEKNNSDIMTVRGLAKLVNE